MKWIALALSMLAITAWSVVGVLTGVWPRVGDDCIAVEPFASLPCQGTLIHDIVITGPSLNVGQSMSSGVPGVELTRITGPRADAASGSRVDLHSYSRRQPWNADESLIALSTSLYDASTLEVVREKMRVSTSRNWSNTNPDLIFGIVYDPKPNVFVRWNIDDDTVEVLRHFSEYERCSIGQGEGNLSNDDRFVLLSCYERQRSSPIGVPPEPTGMLISYDIETNTILGTLQAAPDFNWGSFTQSGRWIVVENSKLGEPVFRLMRYSPELEDETELSQDVQHGDLGMDVEGNDVHVMIGQRKLYYVRIHDGRTVQLQISGSSSEIGFGHVSCRNLQRPGWCYVSSNGSGAVGALRVGVGDGAASRLIDLAGHEGVGLRAFESWGSHLSTGGSYESQPKVAVSPGGTQLLFSSDWNGSIPASDFRLRLLDAQ